MAYLILLYLPPLKKDVTFTYYRYLIQHMGICQTAVLFDNTEVTEDTVQNELGIRVRHIIEIGENEWIIVMKQKHQLLLYNETEYTFRYFINLYSPWFEENIQVDLYTVQVESGVENIDVCLYVLDTCDNHHIYNHHLRNNMVSYGNKTISIYELMEFLVDL